MMPAQLDRLRQLLAGTPTIDEQIEAVQTEIAMHLAFCRTGQLDSRYPTKQRLSAMQAVLTTLHEVRATRMAEKKG